ncbi:hypothetical protein QN345_13835 [Cryobacterium sp. 10I1]|uniref:toxin-antitoxin system YwqK family antitoxin n=1 Tax=unclassified Cryobacterium TaxID=2649013 RepID=UPI002AC94C2A|nr:MULTISPECIES: hypothetical protein [unclassified Cryobacterium]MEB0285332.1 hypothetical protein [Cryobacterium sp. 10S3]MEB0306385.1 hypothetical protein [Cryobacterium sp. 10I1]WPX15321.1 hypothetical protein RHM57_08195 [Cryobacterium sp. 10S3]
MNPEPIPSSAAPGGLHASSPTSRVDHYATGETKASGSTLDGELHGEWEWFRTDGTLMRTGEFDRGRQIGVWRTWARDGSLVKETRFR